MQDASSRNENVDAPYWRALSDQRLVMQRCDICGRWSWPAVCRCGDCGAFCSRLFPLFLFPNGGQVVCDPLSETLAPGLQPLRRIDRTN